MKKYIRHHLAINITGLLNNYKHRQIDCFSYNGKVVSDATARQYLDECLAKGWKCIPVCSEEECPDFDHFEHGCPGHEMEGGDK